MSCHKLYDWLKVAPYQVDQPIDDDDLDISKGVRVLGVSHSTERLFHFNISFKTRYNYV